ncbi:MAG: MoaD/ThiS family protein [Vallitaleaceae bacterium]|nr:MoaD/ThiS family protein [Vallitaleaceae bacterium]
MRVKVSATGIIKNYIPSAKVFELDEGTSIADLKEQCGIKMTITMGYCLNGSLVDSVKKLQDGDELIFIMFVSGG